ncbi:MAG: hypothetical protein OXG79_06470 [Chloroflexi bacterium]|nr:hypothetical protein [Chloroflexota bacterium]
MSLQWITPFRRTGCERLHADGQPVSESNDLLQFWQWMGSDLVANTQRAVVAEYIVGVAVGDACLMSGTRDPWGNYDLTSTHEVRIEVKSAAYVQYWRQARESTPTFDIAKTLAFDPETDQFSDTPTRSADVYVFCLHTHRASDPVEAIDPLNVSQWEFYVLSTAALEDHFGDQKTVRLGSLYRIGARPVRFEDLGSAVDGAFRGD